MNLNTLEMIESHIDDLKFDIDRYDGYGQHNISSVLRTELDFLEVLQNQLLSEMMLGKYKD